MQVHNQKRAQSMRHKSSTTSRHTTIFTMHTSSPASPHPLAPSAVSCTPLDAAATSAQSPFPASFDGTTIAVCDGSPAAVVAPVVVAVAPAVLAAAHLTAARLTAVFASSVVLAAAAAHLPAQFAAAHLPAHLVLLCLAEAAWVASLRGEGSRGL